MLEDIHDGSQTHPTVNKIDACYEIRDCIRQKESQWKGALRATRNMGKGFHKVFSMIVREILQELETLGQSGSEVTHFIPEPRNFAEVAKLLDNIKKPWIKANLKEIKNLINNQNFLIEDQN